MLPWGAGPASGWGPHPLRCHRPGSGLGSLERLPRLLAARCMGCMRPLNAARAAPCLPVQPRWPHPSCLPEHHRSAGDIPAGFLLGWGGPSTWLWNSYWLPRRSPIKAVTPCWGLQRSTTTAATERFLEAACRARGWLSTGQPWQSAMEPEPCAGTTRQSDLEPAPLATPASGVALPFFFKDTRKRQGKVSIPSVQSGHSSVARAFDCLRDSPGSITRECLNGRRPLCWWQPLQRSARWFILPLPPSEPGHARAGLLARRSPLVS